MAPDKTKTRMSPVGIRRAHHVQLRHPGRRSIEGSILLFGSIYDNREFRRGGGRHETGFPDHGAENNGVPKQIRPGARREARPGLFQLHVSMHVATQLFNIREGDEVIVTPTTFIATSLVILKEKARPVYRDIDPRTFNIDPDAVRKKITKKTKAIYVVHYGGLMCDMDPIMDTARKHGLLVMEDCAHTTGAEYKGRRAGSIGDAGCFSFHSLKNITTCGEGA